MAKRFKVGIDIGHGDNTYPSKGKGVRRNGVGYAEHTFNSLVAIQLIKLLELAGIEVVMAQGAFARDVDLTTRTNYYNRMGVDLVVSIHANANGNSAVNGRCVFYWHTNPNGKRLAQLIVKEMGTLGYSGHGNGLHASEKGSWTNLHMTRVPKATSVLIEHGFMTGSQDFDLVFGNKSAKYIQDMAIADAKAICAYAGVKFVAGGASVSKPTSAPKPSVTASKDGAYTVKSGDTLWSIAQAHGLQVTELKSINKLKSDIITTGQILNVRILTDKKDEVNISIPEVYTVKAGDTLYEIAQELCLSLDELIKINGIKDANILKVGQLIKTKSTAVIKPAGSVVSIPKFIVGDRVVIAKSAKSYANSTATIPESVKGKTYTIQQATSDKILLKEIVSWVYKKDIVGASKTVSQPAKAKPTSSKTKLPAVGLWVKTPQFSGKDVLAVQNALASLHFYPEKGAKNNGCDGYYGKKTADAVSRFQSVHGLKVDGKYGNETRRKLESLIK